MADAVLKFQQLESPTNMGKSTMNTIKKSTEGLSASGYAIINSQSDKTTAANEEELII